MSTKYIYVPVTGKLRWVEIWFVDNSSNPNGHQVKKSETKIVRSLRVSQFNESTKTPIENTKQSSSVKMLQLVHLTALCPRASQGTSHSPRRSPIPIPVLPGSKKTYYVEGYGKLGLYQAYFSAPGVDLSLDVTVTSGFKPAAHEVPLVLKMQEQKFISHIQVIYTDNVNDKPVDNIREITGQNEDTNSGFGGKYVWLKPIYTDQVSQAITDCRVCIQGESWPPANGNGPGTSAFAKVILDLAKGAGGKYRYLQFNKDTKNDLKYIEVILVRSAGHARSISEVPGFDVLTMDINKGRKGDFLYLAFKARNALAIEKIPT
ncbi:MAG: hypothetical protein LQ339_005104 [Xanthoria mediterranea]|nr:MAG: hypothetical protein LQ339_005104 [Xanthoria mediterranea]